MIADKFENLSKYPNLAPYAEAMTAFAQRCREEEFPEGRYDLMGDELFGLVQYYNSKPKAEARMEAHKIYSDVQYLFGGEEIICWNPVDEMEIEEDRTPAADILFFRNIEPMGSTHLKEGMFAYYAPRDGHMPCVAVSEPTGVKKICFKILEK